MRGGPLALADVDDDGQGQAAVRLNRGEHPRRRVADAAAVKRYAGEACARGVSCC